MGHQQSEQSGAEEDPEQECFAQTEEEGRVNGQLEQAANNQ